MLKNYAFVTMVIVNLAYLVLFLPIRRLKPLIDSMLEHLFPPAKRSGWLHAWIERWLGGCFIEDEIQENPFNMTVIRVRKLHPDGILGEPFEIIYVMDTDTPSGEYLTLEAFFRKKGIPAKQGSCAKDIREVVK